jgi:hypothetical protein
VGRCVWLWDGDALALPAAESDGVGETAQPAANTIQLAVINLTVLDIPYSTCFAHRILLTRLLPTIASIIEGAIPF